MESKIQMDMGSLEEFQDTLKEELETPRTLTEAVKELKAQSTQEEYETLIKEMFDKLDRVGKRKVINKSAKFSEQVKRALYKKNN
jgi:transcriptional regulatory protein LevR